MRNIKRKPVQRKGASPEPGRRPAPMAFRRDTAGANMPTEKEMLMAAQIAEMAALGVEHKCLEKAFANQRAVRV